MRILVVNNFVRHGSGTDASVELELRALAARGHEVLLVARDNHEFDRVSGMRRAALYATTLYSFAARAEIEGLLRRRRVDVVHAHNLVPLLTGAVYDACGKHGVPVVQHLRNYRAFCLSSYGYRDGRPCDDCSRSAFAACAVHRCYRDSAAASAGLVAARWVDWARGRKTGYRAAAYIANSHFTKTKHVDHGLPAASIRVLHNPADDLAALLDGGPVHVGWADFARKLTFVGSLIEAKGIWPALDLAAALQEFEFHFVGAGAGRPAIEQAARRRGLANVTFHGVLGGAAKAAVWADSFLTVVPSLWEEPFGLVVPESCSLGVPVLATTSGGLAETVVDGQTGLILDPSRIGDAAANVRELWRDRPRYLAMRAAAREEYERRFTADIFAQGLEDVLGSVSKQGAIAGAAAS